MENGLKDRKRVLFVITKSNWGGAQRYVFDLATNLPKNEYEAMVALGGDGTLKEKLKEGGITIFPIADLTRDIGLLKELKAFVSIYKIIKEVNPDIVHLNSSKAGALGALGVRLYNTYVFLFNFLHPTPYTLHPTLIIFTAHGWAFKEKRRAFFKKIIEYISWLTIALSDKVIVVSNDDNEKIKRFLFVKNKTVVIQNGINPPLFKDKETARKIISEKLGKEIGGDFWIGSIGELHKNKGIEYALSAIGQIARGETSRKINPHGLRFVIVGNGEERENLEKAMAREGVGEIVSFAGEIPNASELYKAFDIFILPSLKEGLPYVLLEAGSAGLPIIASNVGGTREVIDDMKSGIIIKPKRPKEIADALAFLIDNQEKRKEFGENLAKTTSENFTLKRMVKETTVLYQNLS